MNFFQFRKEIYGPPRVISLIAYARKTAYCLVNDRLETDAAISSFAAPQLARLYIALCKNTTPGTIDRLFSSSSSFSPADQSREVKPSVDERPVLPAHVPFMRFSMPLAEGYLCVSPPSHWQHQFGVSAFLAPASDHLLFERQFQPLRHRYARSRQRHCQVITKQGNRSHQQVQNGLLISEKCLDTVVLYLSFCRAKRV